MLSLNEAVPSGIPAERSRDVRRGAPPERAPRALSVREITPAAVTERLCRRLRDLIGPGRRWSYAEIAARTLIDIRTLKAYVSGSACPNLAKYKRLVAVIGPEVAIELNLMLGWEPRATRRAPEAVDLDALRAALAQADRVLALVAGEGGAAPQVRTLPAPAAMRHDTLPEYARPLSPRAITPDSIARRLSFRLRKVLNGEGKWSTASLAEAAGISRGVIEAYVAGSACPNLARYFRLERVVGPELGIEFALMLGWEPRFQSSRPLSHEALALLRSHFRACEASIGSVLAADLLPSRLVAPTGAAAAAPVALVRN